MSEWRLSPGGVAALAAIAVAAASLGSGCAGGGRSGARATVEIAQQASYDHHFYSEPGEFAKLSEAERRALIETEIERLAGPAWETARARLFTMGREAIGLLIKNLDRTEPTEAALRSLPGRAVKDKADTWTLGQVVYAVLCEFVGCHTNYASQLPRFDKAEWEAWWAKNSNLTVYSDLTRAPPYVHAQMEAERKALSARYEPTKLAEEKKLARAPAAERRGAKKERAPAEKAVKAETPAPRPAESKGPPEASKPAGSVGSAPEKAKAAEPESRRGGRKKPSQPAPSAAPARAPAPAAPQPSPAAETEDEGAE